MAQEEIKKTMQICSHFFDLVSICPGDLMWITDVAASYFQSGTPTANRGGSSTKIWLKLMRKKIQGKNTKAVSHLIQAYETNGRDQELYYHNGMVYHYQ